MIDTVPSESALNQREKKEEEEEENKKEWE